VNFFNKGTEAEVEATGSFVGVKENRISGRYRIRLPNGVEIESEDMPLVMLERLLHYVGE